ncbi:hypothetical protein Tco_0160569, partial [Tanacetum coccineum]
LNIKLPLLEHLNRTALSKDETVLLLRLLERVATACYTQNRWGKSGDKMKEKGDPYVMVGYSTQSKGYRVYNKRTCLIVESIHIKFDEIKEMMFEHSSSKLGRQCQMVSAENNTSGPIPQCLVLHQMTSDHNRSELGIHDHINDPLSSKLVPKVVP